MGESRGRSFRKTWRWIQLSQQMRTVLPPWCTYPGCACPTGRTIDLTLSHRHRWSWTLDHTIELQDGGNPYDPSYLTAMHRACNASKGAKRQAARKQEALRVRAHANEHHAPRSTTTPSRGGGSNPGEPTHAKTPESWCPLSSSVGGAS